MIQDKIKQSLADSLNAIYQIDTDASKIVIEKTSGDFEGDFTFVVFPYLKISRKNPEQTATEIGNHLCENSDFISKFQVIKGFLNLHINDSYWLNFISTEATNASFGTKTPDSKEKVLVEYSSPNTNKPLHLGHIRNNLLGYSVIQILKANGYEVKSCNLINDRGIHICKSMYAWMQQVNGESPESSGL